MHLLQDRHIIRIMITLDNCYFRLVQPSSARECAALDQHPGSGSVRVAGQLLGIVAAIEKALFARAYVTVNLRHFHFCLTQMFFIVIVLFSYFIFSLSLP